MYSGPRREPEEVASLKVGYGTTFERIDGTAVKGERGDEYEILPGRHQIVLVGSAIDYETRRELQSQQASICFTAQSGHRYEVWTSSLMTWSDRVWEHHLREVVGGQPVAADDCVAKTGMAAADEKLKKSGARVSTTEHARANLLEETKDSDGDGIPDLIDKCPNDAEDMDGFQDEDGCPDPDNDGDSIPDVDDLCPNSPETYNGIEDDDGCPDGHGKDDRDAHNLCATCGRPAAEVLEELRGLKAIPFRIEITAGNQDAEAGQLYESALEVMLPRGPADGPGNPKFLVRVSVEHQAISGRYRVGVLSYGVGVLKYSGARARGKLEVLSEGSVVFARSFSSSVAPRESVSSKFFDNPESAPFSDIYGGALVSILYDLIELLGERVEQRVLVATSPARTKKMWKNLQRGDAAAYQAARLKIQTLDPLRCAGLRAMPADLAIDSAVLEQLIAALAMCPSGPMRYGIDCDCEAAVDFLKGAPSSSTRKLVLGRLWKAITDRSLPPERRAAIITALSSSGAIRGYPELTGALRAASKDRNESVRKTAADALQR